VATGRHKLYASLVGFSDNQPKAPQDQEACVPSQPTLVYAESSSSKFAHNTTAATVLFRTLHSERHTS